MQTNRDHQIVQFLIFVFQGAASPGKICTSQIAKQNKQIYRKIHTLIGNLDRDSQEKKMVRAVELFTMRQSIRVRRWYTIYAIDALTGLLKREMDQIFIFPEMWGTQEASEMHQF